MLLHRYWKFQSQNAQTFGYVYRNTNGPNHGPVWKTQSFLLNGICTVIFWQDKYGKRNSGKFYWNTVGEKFQIWNAYLLTAKKRLFLSVYVDDSKLAGKKQNIDPMWKELMKEIDLREPTSFLDHVYMGCTQREWDIVSRISAGATEKLTCSGRLDSNISTWSYDMEGHAKKCVERYCELVNKNITVIVQSRNSMPWRPSVRRRRIRICWRIVKELLLHCPEISVFGTHW